MFFFVFLSFYLVLWNSVRINWVLVIYELIFIRPKRVRKSTILGVDSKLTGSLWNVNGILSNSRSILCCLPNYFLFVTQILLWITKSNSSKEILIKHLKKLGAYFAKCVIKVLNQILFHGMKSSQPTKMKQVCNRMQRRDGVSWNLVISRYVFFM